MDNVQPGQTLGPYRVINQIGQGGMATVYKAYHAAMDRYVAIKVLPRQLAESPEFHGRFQQEARTLAKLEHPHILPVHDFGESEDGISYLVMRYLEAGTLKDRLHAGPLTLTEIDTLFSQLADALGYAHEQGVIHRDLKPSNAMLDTRGSLFLTDFGIAKLLEGSSQFTSTGAMMGTPAYMSPEQARGDKVDQRTDLYSLGIILYEMVTRRLPFEAETPLAVVLKQLNEPLPLPSLVFPDIHPAVERVILKALAKDAADRFASVAEFMTAWKQAVRETAGTPSPTAEQTLPGGSTAPTLIHPAPAGDAAPRAGARFPVGWAIGAGVVIILLIMGFFAIRFVRNRRAAQLPKPTVIATQPASTARPVATSAPTAMPQPTASPIPGVSGDTTWTSWTAANNVEVVASYNGDLYAGGWGGVTVWNQETGEVIERFTTGTGLSDPHVRALLIDHETGHLWVGTDGGLAFYDGHEWTLYNAQDGLDSNNISALGWWQQYLVVGTESSDRAGGGLNLFDGAQWSAMPDFPSDHPDNNPNVLANFVYAIAQAEDGTLWVGTANGLGRYDGNAWTRFTTAEGLPANRVYTLFFDEAQTLWVGTEAGAAQFDGEQFIPTELGPPYGVYGITQDTAGRYWFSGGGGVWRFDPTRSNWDEYSEQTGDMPSYNIFGVTLGDDENLYWGSDGSGLVRFDGDFAVWRVKNLPGLAAFGAILPAPDGRLAFEQLYGGYVDIFDPTAETWTPGPSIPGTPLTFDSAGNLWATEWENGVWVINPQGQTTHIGAEQGLPNEAHVRGVAVAPDGTAWIATDKGLAFCDGQTVTEFLTAADTGLASDSIYGVFLASDGGLWVATNPNFSRRAPDGQWEHFTAGNPLSFDVGIRDIAEAADGSLWLATGGDGVYHWNKGEWEHFSTQNSDLPEDDVNAVAVAPDGSLWFGLARRGAARFDGENWSEFEVDAEAGLINPSVNAIYIAPEGTVWFATSGGVTRYQP